MRNQGTPKHPLVVLNILGVALCIVMLFIAFLVSGPMKTFESHAANHPATSRLPPIKTVFIILMENHNWSSIRGSASAPYINKTLLPMASYANEYYTPPGNHPSLPNYLWLEAGTNFGVLNDNPPAVNHQSTTNHLVTLLQKAGYSWKAYLEGISGQSCPLQNSGLYAVRHNATVYFDDVTGTNNPKSAGCIAHERPYTELATDLHKNTVANYNYIVPDLCNDMHAYPGCKTTDEVKRGDTWFAANVPQILNSPAYRSGGVLFITWDEGSHDSNGPIGMIVLSPYAMGHGYSNSIHYTHSSTLLTIEEIFGLRRLLNAPTTGTDLSNLLT